MLVRGAQLDRGKADGLAHLKNGRQIAGGRDVVGDDSELELKRRLGKQVGRGRVGVGDGQCARGKARRSKKASAVQGMHESFLSAWRDQGTMALLHRRSRARDKY